VLSLDDRTGNVLTTIGLFAAVVGLAFAARATLVVSVLALLLAYLLEPAVALVQRHLPSRPSNRTVAIAVVYLLGALLLVGGGYALERPVAGQMRRLSAGLPDIRARLTDQQFLAEHISSISGAIERTTQAAAAAAEQAGWLLTVPVIAVFFLKSRDELIDGTVNVFARTRDRASVKRMIGQVDAMLGQYTCAQLAAAGLSAVFYSLSMAVLGFPCPIPLAVLGGALEFLPVFGWILAAAAILLSGWLAHAPWIWMAGLIVVWRILQNFVISPRILGDRLQMEPMTVFLALMAGGEVAGLLGMVLSLPVVAVLRILWLERSSRKNAAVA
jgi:predicted PurR-regulated permease PerM